MEDNELEKGEAERQYEVYVRHMNMFKLKVFLQCILFFMGFVILFMRSLGNG